MRSTYRLTALTLAALLLLGVAVYHYRSRWGERLAAPVTRIMPPMAAPVTLIMPPMAAPAKLHEVMSDRTIATAKERETMKRARGARLREKGEAIFGGALELVAVGTGTKVAQ